MSYGSSPVFRSALDVAVSQYLTGCVLVLATSAGSITAQALVRCNLSGKTIEAFTNGYQFTVTN